jgi:hypothetical protein
MKNYSQIQKIISLIMIFILMIHLSGCVSSKILSKSDLPVSGDYPYKIQCKKTSFLLPNVEISNGKLSGKVEMTGSTRYANIVNIYLTSDSVIKINTEKILSLPCDSITKVKLVQASPAKTFFLIIGITAGLLLIFINTISFDFNPFPNGI